MSELLGRRVMVQRQECSCYHVSHHVNMTTFTCDYRTSIGMKRTDRLPTDILPTLLRTVHFLSRHKNIHSHANPSLTLVLIVSGHFTSKTGLPMRPKAVPSVSRSHLCEVYISSAASGGLGQSYQNRGRSSLDPT